MIKLKQRMIKFVGRLLLFILGQSGVFAHYKLG